MLRSRSSSLRFGRIGLMFVLLSLLAPACTAAVRSPARGPDAVISVGSFDFPESDVLARLYVETLRDHGYPVRLVSDIGPREIVGPALGRGLLDLVPEYAGSALTFFSLGAVPPSHDPVATHDALLRALASRGLVPLAPAPAQDANAIVVTAATADRLRLRTISDLGPVARTLVFGGPPECPQRPLCLQGLRDTYGIRFRAFVATDTDGPVTLEALLSGEIDVAELNTTTPSIEADHLVVLADDRGLQPAENVTPVIRGVVLTRYGPAFSEFLDAVSAALTSADLTALDSAVMRDPSAAPGVARRWLASHGLV